MTKYIGLRQFTDDINSLSASALRKKYWREANSHRNGKSRARKGDYSWDPRIETFRDFLSCVGRIPGLDYSLDRIDSSDPEYAPDKIRWTNKRGQTHNRANTRYLTDSKGKKLSLAEWSRRKKIPATTIMRRIDQNDWTVDEALNTPVNARRGKPDFGNGQRTPRSSTPYVGLWTEILKETHDQGFCSFSAKDKKMIKDIAYRFEEQGLPALQVIACVLSKWMDYTTVCEKDYGAFGNTPRVPSIDWLTKYCNAAGNFYLEQQHQD